MNHIFDKYPHHEPLSYQELYQALPQFLDFVDQNPALNQALHQTPLDDINALDRDVVAPCYQAAPLQGKLPTNPALYLALRSYVHDQQNRNPSLTNTDYFQDRSAEGLAHIADYVIKFLRHLYASALLITERENLKQQEKTEAEIAQILAPLETQINDDTINIYQKPNGDLTLHPVAGAQPIYQKKLPPPPLTPAPDASLTSPASAEIANENQPSSLALSENTALNSKPQLSSDRAALTGSLPEPPPEDFAASLLSSPQVFAAPLAAIASAAHDDSKRRQLATYKKDTSISQSKFAPLPSPSVIRRYRPSATTQQQQSQTISPEESNLRKAQSPQTQQAQTQKTQKLRSQKPKTGRSPTNILTHGLENQMKWGLIGGISGSSLIPLLYSMDWNRSADAAQAVNNIFKAIASSS